jgi:hypothetical protein
MATYSAAISETVAIGENLQAHQPYSGNLLASLMSPQWSGGRNGYPGGACGRGGQACALGLLTVYRMRGWSASLGKFVEWTAPNIDASASYAPVGSGTIVDIVWLKNY